MLWVEEEWHISGQTELEQVILFKKANETLVFVFQEIVSIDAIFP
jgi:hypothetical protein